MEKLEDGHPVEDIQLAEGVLNINERRFLVVSATTHSNTVAASVAKTGSLAIKMVTEKLKEQGVDLTPCVAGKRVVVRHNGYCHYYDKQPRKTAQWKNEQRRFRK